MELDLSDQERQLIEILREWGGDADERIVIAYRDGAWDFSMSRKVKDKIRAIRGTGVSFARAWDDAYRTDWLRPGV